MQIECLVSLDATQSQSWDDFLSRAARQHPRQSTRFAASEEAQGRKVLYAIGRDGGEIRALALISCLPHPFLPGRWKQAHCLSGPVCDDPDALVRFLDALARDPALSGVGGLHVTPFWTGEDARTLDRRLEDAGWAIGEQSRFRSTGWIDIARSGDEIMAAFSKSARREVRRAERQGVTFRPITAPDEAREFLASLNRLRESRGLAPMAPPAFDAAFRDVYAGGEMGVILGAWLEGAFIAGLLVYRSRDVVHGRHFTTETDALRAAGNLRISPALWLEGMNWGRDKGCRWLDVEGYEPPVAGSPRHNIYKYKSELGPEVVERISERVRVLSPTIHLTGNLRETLRKRLGPVYAKWRKRDGG